MEAEIEIEAAAAPEEVPVEKPVEVEVEEAAAPAEVPVEAGKPAEKPAAERPAPPARAERVGRGDRVPVHPLPRRSHSALVSRPFSSRGVELDGRGFSALDRDRGRRRPVRRAFSRSRSRGLVGGFRDGRQRV